MFKKRTRSQSYACKIEDENGYHIVTKQGMTRWYDKEGKLHRENGPAEVFPNGTQKWYRHGFPHREDGPASIYANGNLEYWVDGKLHREDGPARIYHDGSEDWYINGEYRKDLKEKKYSLLCFSCKKRRLED